MPIKFDTLDELKAFYRTFKLSGKSIDELDLPEAPKKRGRKPGVKVAAKVDSSTADTAEAPKKRGRKPGTKVVATAVKKATLMNWICLKHPKSAVVNPA